MLCQKVGSLSEFFVTSYGQRLDWFPNSNILFLFGLTSHLYSKTTFIKQIILIVRYWPHLVFL